MMNWTLQIDSENQTFKNKHKDLFAELDKVKTELSHERYIDDTKESDLCTNSRSITKTYKGKKSIFKIPAAPLRKCLLPRRRPDYQVNPQNWTKYSLSDVTAEDMSDASNKSAALSFLKELEKRKEDERGQGERIRFKNSVMIPLDQKDGEEKNIFVNSKRIMPEYVVGQKIKKEKTNRVKGCVSKNKELTLSHLTQDEAEDNT